MRHRRDTLKLGRTSSHRKAMFRNMVTSLFKYDRIRTTDVKAKELRRWADQMITLAKRGDLHARRLVLSVIRERDVVQKLFDEAQDRYGSVSGGYTRVVKLGFRPGDAAPVSIIELISREDVKKKSAKKPKKTTKTPKTAAPEVAQPETSEEEPAVEASPEAPEADVPVVEETAEAAVDAPEEAEAATEEVPVEAETAEEAPTEETPEEAPEEGEKKEE